MHSNRTVDSGSYLSITQYIMLRNRCLNIATLLNCSNFFIIGIAEAAFCQVPFGSRSSLKWSGTTFEIAPICETMSHHGRGLSLKLVYPFFTASFASAAQSFGAASIDHHEIGYPIPYLVT